MPIKHLPFSPCNPLLHRFHDTVDDGNAWRAKVMVGTGNGIVVCVWHNFICIRNQIFILRVHLFSLIHSFNYAQPLYLSYLMLHFPQQSLQCMIQIAWRDTENCALDGCKRTSARYNMCLEYAVSMCFKTDTLIVMR